jgi:hypothetical protein
LRGKAVTIWLHPALAILDSFLDVLLENPSLEIPKPSNRDWWRENTRHNRSNGKKNRHNRISENKKPVTIEVVKKKPSQSK